MIEEATQYALGCAYTLITSPSLIASDSNEETLRGVPEGKVGIMIPPEYHQKMVPDIDDRQKQMASNQSEYMSRHVW